MSEHLNLDATPPVAVLTLNRPEKLNALTAEMVDALAAAAERIEAEAEVRAALLTAEGERAFCVGADITAWSALSPLEMWRSWTARGHRAFERLARLRVPLIAVIGGHALGGGLELAAAADFRIAEEHARFGLPEVGIATIPGWSGTQRLSGLLPLGILKEMALTGRRLSAERALALGLVNEVSDDPMAAARAMADEIATVSKRHRLAQREVMIVGQEIRHADTAEPKEKGTVIAGGETGGSRGFDPIARCDHRQIGQRPKPSKVLDRVMGRPKLAIGHAGAHAAELHIGVRIRDVRFDLFECAPGQKARCGANEGASS